MRAIQHAVSELDLPASIRVEYGGPYAQQRQSFADLSAAFVAALMLFALLLTVLFERLAWTLAAVARMLPSVAAVFGGLWVTGAELNMFALVGLTMVIGIVGELVISFMTDLPPVGVVDAAVLLAAGARRLRPIKMSALIAILTLAPRVSRSAGLQQPLATAIIFGLIAAVPLVLLFLPALLVMMQGRQAAAPRDEAT